MKGNSNKSDYSKEFPKRLMLLGKEYSVDFVSENNNELKICIGLNKKVLKHYVFGKNEGYINMIYFENIVARNFEGYLYWKEVCDCGIEDDDRLPIYFKYRRKGVVTN